MKYEIIEREFFQVIGAKRELSCGTMDAGILGIPEFWDEANKNGMVDQLLQLNNGEIKGLLGLTENYNQENNTIDYWIATEYSGDVLDEYRGFELPASKWIVFEARGPVPSSITHTLRKVYSEWIPSHQYELANIATIEAYIDTDIYRKNSLNQIWLPIK